MNAVRFIILFSFISVLPGTARAQSLQSCLDDSLPADERVETCSRIVEATPSGLARAQALFGRADAQFMLLDDADLPPAAFDAVLADLDESDRSFRNWRTLYLRAMVRLYRGDVALALRPLYFQGQWEEAEAAITPMIAAQPGDVDLLVLRAAFRTLTNRAGGPEDIVEALRIKNAMP